MFLSFRGYIKYSDPVVKEWPEFGANGKEEITVDTLLSHQVCFIDNIDKGR